MFTSLSLSSTTYPENQNPLLISLHPSSMELTKAAFVLSYFLILTFIHVSIGTDNISANQTLSGNRTLISKGEVFELGFYSPGNSSKYYICMWYYKIRIPTIVWVANRETPILDKFSSQLKFIDGNLVLLNETQFPIWSTNSTSASEATLLDDGNFVLNDGSNSSAPIWQSFDHPTHTWLPGMKVGLDKRTHVNTKIISWKNSENPAPGLFSLEIDSNGTSQYYSRWNGSKIYWSSGVWDGTRFSNVPEMTANYIYNFEYVNNTNDSYFNYTVINPMLNISRMVMDLTGLIRQYNWLPVNGQWNSFWNSPKGFCDVYTVCGGSSICNQNSLPICNCPTGFKPRSVNDWNLSDFSGGCVTKTQLQCGFDKFLLMSDMTLPENGTSVSVGSQNECELACLNDCSCSSYSYSIKGCFLWMGDFYNVQQLEENGEPFSVRISASEFSHNSNSKKGSKGLVIGVVAGSIVGVIALVGLVWCVISKRRRRVGKGKAVEGSLVSFEYRDMQNATKNFSEKLGGGGFGSVFKGVLADASVVAVKKLENIGQGEKQFRTEVSTIGTIQHVNLVRLRGFCSDGGRKLLVYDYMPNGSLDSQLFRENASKVLDWKIRYQIALGVARGLTYLHEKCRDCIIHCDIKPENILLDSEFCAKVADFGLAKLIGREFSRVLTTMRGTRGYLAPEWISGVAITAKADVFSYGMMAFELISGKRNSEVSEDGKRKFFPTYAASKLAEGGEILGLLDPRLEGVADEEEVMRVCRVACWCVQDEEAHRPSMAQIVQILEGVSEVNHPPIPRSLQMFGESQENIVFFTESSSSQSSGTRSHTSAASSQTKSLTSKSANSKS